MRSDAHDSSLLPHVVCVFLMRQASIPRCRGYQSCLGTLRQFCALCQTDPKKLWALDIDDVGHIKTYFYPRSGATLAMYSDPTAFSTHARISRAQQLRCHLHRCDLTHSHPLSLRFFDVGGALRVVPTILTLLQHPVTLCSHSSRHSSHPNTSHVL
jgi:hypothetical protein